MAVSTRKIFPSHAEAPPSDAGDDLELPLVGWLSFHAERAGVLDPGNLVPGRTVVFGELGLDDDLGIDLVGDDKVRRLIEAGEPLRAPGLAIADARSNEHVLDGILDDVANQLADGISMSGKRAAEKAFVQEDGVRCAQIGERANADKVGCDTVQASSQRICYPMLDSRAKR